MLDNGLSLDRASQLALNIYTQHSNFIRKVIRYSVKNESQADDVFQKFFLHLLLNPVPDGIEHIENYLYRAVLNCISKDMKQAINYQVKITEYAKAVAIIKTEVSPEEAFINAQETAKLFALIHKQLSSKEFTAIDLYYKDSRSIQEIAVAMRVKTSSVRRNIARGIQKLRVSFISQEVLDESIIRSSPPPDHGCANSSFRTHRLTSRNF